MHFGVIDLRYGIQIGKLIEGKRFAVSLVCRKISGVEKFSGVEGIIR